MLSEAHNRLLTRVGPGTPMGNYLRRYWQPIAGVSEFDKSRSNLCGSWAKILVLYKDLSGNFGLIDRHCPHRRADLSYGYVEELRPAMQLSRLAATTRAAPASNSPMKTPPRPRHVSKKRSGSKPIRPASPAACCGPIWARSPRRNCRIGKPSPGRTAFMQIVFAEIPCNWLQCQENSIDPVHFEWMHSNWSIRLCGKTGPYTPKHMQA